MMSLKGAIEWTDFYLYPPGIIPPVGKIHETTSTRVKFSIGINKPTVVVPPSSIAYVVFNFCCTVDVTKCIIIIIICAKLLSIKRTSSQEWVSRSDASKAINNSQWILISSTSYFKHIVVKVGSGLVLKFKIYPELPLASLGNVFQAIPEFSIEISKSFLVVTPWSVKIYRAISPSLYHCPSSICCLGITENTSGTPLSSTPTLHLVNTRRFLSKEEKIISVTTCFNGNIINGTLLFNVVSCSA